VYHVCVFSCVYVYVCARACLAPLFLLKTRNQKNTLAHLLLIPRSRARTHTQTHAGGCILYGTDTGRTVSLTFTRGIERGHEVCLSFCLSAYLSVGLSVSVCLSVCRWFLACDIHHAVPFLSLIHAHTRRQYQHRHLHRTKQRVSGHRLGSAPSAVAPQQAEQGVGCPVQAPPPLGRSHGPPRLLSSRRPRRVCGAGAPPLVDAVSSLSFSSRFFLSLSLSLALALSLPASLSLSFPLFLSSLSSFLLSLFSLFVSSFFLFLSIAPALPPSWTSWRGRRENGAVTIAGLLRSPAFSWPSEGPPTDCGGTVVSARLRGG
jgi:hypothetical protein